MNKEEALKKIEELKQFVEKLDKKNNHSYVEGSTYAEAKNQLSSDERPPTLKEIMVARIEQPELFKVFLDTCTVIIKKEDSNFIKIVPMCKELLTLDKNFNENYLQVDYESIEGLEINKNTDMKYLWLLAMGGDNSENKALYEEYKKALLQSNSNLQTDEVMRFYV